MTKYGWLLGRVKNHTNQMVALYFFDLWPRDGSLSYVHFGHCRQIAIAVIDAGFVMLALLVSKGLAMDGSGRPSPFLNPLL